MAGAVTVIGAATTIVLPKDPGRSMVILSNASNENISLNFGADAVLNSGVVLKPLGPPLILDSNGPLSALVNQPINAICASGTKNLAHYSR